MISKIADQFQIEYIECSAITQHNLKEVFDLAILYGLSKRKYPRTKTLSQNQSLTQTNIIKEKNNYAKNYKNSTKKSTTNSANTIRGLLSNVVNGNNNTTIFNNNNENHNHKKNNQKNEIIKHNEHKLNNRSNNDTVTQKLKYFITKEQPVWNEKDIKKNVYEKPEKINQFHKNNISNKQINDNFTYKKPTSPVLYNRCGYDSRMHSERSMPSTTFKDGFKKLVTMTRRFL